MLPPGYTILHRPVHVPSLSFPVYVGPFSMRCSPSSISPSWKVPSITGTSPHHISTGHRAVRQLLVPDPLTLRRPCPCIVPSSKSPGSGKSLSVLRIYCMRRTMATRGGFYHCTQSHHACIHAACLSHTCCQYLRLCSRNVGRCSFTHPYPSATPSFRTSPKYADPNGSSKPDSIPPSPEINLALCQLCSILSECNSSMMGYGSAARFTPVRSMLKSSPLSERFPADHLTLNNRVRSPQVESSTESTESPLAVHSMLGCGSSLWSLSRLLSKQTKNEPQNGFLVSSVTQSPDCVTVPGPWLTKIDSLHPFHWSAFPAPPSVARSSR